MSKLKLRKELDDFKKDEGATIEPPANTALHLWHVDLLGRVKRLLDCSDPGVPGLDIVALPAGKFLPAEYSIAREPDWIWNQHFANLLEVPEQPPAIPQLLDAPRPPAFAEVALTDAEPLDATVDRPADIDRDAVIDFVEQRRKRAARAEADDPYEPVVAKRSKSLTREERYRQLQAEIADSILRPPERDEPRLAVRMAMAPTVGPDWKGH